MIARVLGRVPVKFQPQSFISFRVTGLCLRHYGFLAFPPPDCTTPVAIGVIFSDFWHVGVLVNEKHESAINKLVRGQEVGKNGV